MSHLLESLLLGHGVVVRVILTVLGIGLPYLLIGFLLWRFVPGFQ